jgi:hypothetical protein
VRSQTTQPGRATVLLVDPTTMTRHATRCYRDGLLVERIVHSKVRGTLGLSPDGTGTTVDRCVLLTS